MSSASLTTKWRKNNSDKTENINLDSEKVEEVKNNWRQRFQEEFQTKKFPRHPYKIVQEIRKETGNYNNSLESEEFKQGLHELKEEFKPEYHQLKKQYSTK